MAKDFTRRCAWMCFLGYVAMFTIGAVDAKTNFTAVKKTPSPKEWQVFYKACPGFKATDSACLELERLAVEKGLNLKKAYQSYYTGEELRLRNEAEEVQVELVTLFEESEWTSFLNNCPEFEATDSNCARLEEKALQIEEGLEDTYAELQKEDLVRFDWATWYAIHPEFEATDSNCVRLEEQIKEERSGK